MPIIRHVTEVLSELGAQLNLPELQFDAEFNCFLAFDGQAINIQLIQDKLMLTTHVITLPETSDPHVYTHLLQSNLYGAGTGGAIIALAPDGQGVILQDVMDGATSNVNDLILRLENLLATTQLLVKQIQDS